MTNSALTFSTLQDDGNGDKGGETPEVGIPFMTNSALTFTLQDDGNGDKGGETPEVFIPFVTNSALTFSTLQDDGNGDKGVETPQVCIIVLLTNFALTFYSIGRWQGCTERR
jgi:hypothetical protein